MEILPNNTSQEKKILWQKEKEIVDKITDRLGLEIDEGIKDAVIALRLFGINTTASHEGDMDSYPVPYIDIESPQAIAMRKERKSKIYELRSDEEKKLIDQIQILYQEMRNLDNWKDDKYKAIDKKITDLEKKLQVFKIPKSEEIVELLKQIKVENLKEQEKIEDLVKSFYKDRFTDDESILAPELIGGFGSVRLQSRGTEIQEEETDEVKKIERLHRFQGEMNAFTEFLKNKFFEV